MRQASWLFASGIASIWAVSTFSCSSTENRGDELTVTFSAQSTVVGAGGVENVASSSVVSSSAVTTGMGGAGGMGGMGEASVASSSSMSSSAMSSSSTGDPPPPVETAIHGCLMKDAVDLTGGGTTVTVSFAAGKFTATVAGNQVGLGFPMCLKIKFNQRLTFGGSSALGGPLLIGGFFDGDIGFYDKKSPIQPTCITTNGFDPNSTTCYSGGTWPCGLSTTAATATVCNNVDQKSWNIKAYPFYNNSKKELEQGVVYILP